MYLEGGGVVKASNETAYQYFKKSADKVCSAFFTNSSELLKLNSSACVKLHFSWQDSVLTLSKTDTVGEVKTQFNHLIQEMFEVPVVLFHDLIGHSGWCMTLK